MLKDFKFISLSSMYLKQTSIHYKKHAVSLIILGLAFASSTMLQTDYNNLIIDYAAIILLSNFIQIYSNAKFKNLPQYKGFFNELSNKMIYVGTLKGVEPIINELLYKPVLNTKQDANSAAFVSSRFIYGRINYEKNALFDPDYKLSCSQAILKSLIPAISCKLFEYLIGRNMIGIWAVYSLSKSFADCLAKNKFQFSISLDSLLRTESYKPIYYGFEFLMSQTCDFLTAPFPTIKNSLLLTSIAHAIYKDAYESFVLTPVSKTIINTISDSVCNSPTPPLENRSRSIS